MSAKIMGEVWELELPFNKQWILMAMADHAHHDGTNVHPRLPLIAWKTGYSLSSVKRLVAELRDDGILIPYGHTEWGVVIYRIELAHVPRKPPFVESRPGRPFGRMERKPREGLTSPSTSPGKQQLGFDVMPGFGASGTCDEALEVMTDEEWDEEFGVNN
jgi:hypothetical protein